MLIATWNVNSLGARLPRVVAWLDRARPEVVLLQETKCSDQAFPLADFAALGYRGAHHGEGRWNGVAVLSRVGLERPSPGLRVPAPDGRLEGRYLSAECGGLRVASVYVPNGRELGHPHFTYKLAFLAELRRQAERDLGGGTLPLLLGGDFNIAPTDADVFDPAAFVGLTHVSPEERSALAALLDSGLQDLAALPGQSPAFTYWDYRQGFFHRGLGMRIDLLLGSAPLARTVRRVLVDREERKGPRPSDHAPVMVELGLP